ncbi:toll/interleukin-1 receptor domain-containing protein [Roseivivax sp. CAU 1753]
MTRVFISHASRDFETVQRLARGLEARGIEVWLAPEQIAFGQDYADRLVEGMKSCDATVLVLSVDAMRSRHVRREIEIANDLGHSFYPVRLLELALAQEFSYFINEGRWVDLFSGDVEARYDELAEAVRTGSELSHKGAARDRRRFWGAFGALIVAVSAALVGVLVYQSRIDAALQDEAVFADDYPDTFASLSRFDNSETGLAPVRSMIAVLYTPFAQTEPIGLQLREPAGRLVGAGSFPPKNASVEGEDNEYHMRMNILSATGPVEVCILFHTADGELRALRKTSTELVDFDNAREIVELERGEDCNSVFGSAPSAEEIAALRDAMALAAYETRHSYALLTGIKQPLGSWDQDETVFQLRRNDRGGRLPRSVELVIETGPDGESWPANEILRAGADGQFATEYTYAREVDQFLRACVATAYLDDRIVAHEMMFQRDANGGFALIDERGPALKSDADYCRISRDPANGLIGPSVVGSPLDEALPSDPGSKKSLQIGGISLGMPFDDAVALARAALPKAVERSVSPPADMLSYGGVSGFGEITRLEDEQRGRIIALMRHVQAGREDTVGTIYFSARFEKNGPTLEAVEARAIEMFGPHPLRGSGGLSDALHMYWSTGTDQACRHIDLRHTRPLGLSYVNRADCGTEISVQASFANSGRGPFTYDIGLYDFAAMGAPAE